MILYGINNCDAVRKARKWLDDHAISHQFHDYRKDGLDTGLIEHLEAAVGWERLLNRRSTSWRRLPETERSGMSREKAQRLMLNHPTLIKRPLLDTGSDIIIGFSNKRR